MSPWLNIVGEAPNHKDRDLKKKIENNYDRFIIEFIELNRSNV